jgi:hypothetical protein
LLPLPASGNPSLSLACGSKIAIATSACLHTVFSLWLSHHLSFMHTVYVFTLATFMRTPVLLDEVHNNDPISILLPLWRLSFQIKSHCEVLWSRTLSCVCVGWGGGERERESSVLECPLDNRVEHECVGVRRS